MERGPVVFAALFVLVPLVLVAASVFAPSAAYGLTVTMLALLGLGFGLAIAFVDVD